jgi:hypothetical protein
MDGRGTTEGWELTDKVNMLLQNRIIEQATGVIAIAKPSNDGGAVVQSRGRGSEKKGPKTPNEANSWPEINNLTEKTNPNEANKSFVLGVPP